MSGPVSKARATHSGRESPPASFSLTRNRQDFSFPITSLTQESFSSTMSTKLAAFKHKLQNHIRMDDREWSYTVPNLPGPGKLDNARLIKMVRLVLTGGKHEINLSFVGAQDNRATRGEPLNKFLIVSIAELRAPPRSAVSTASSQDSLQPSTSRECVEYATRLLKTGVSIQGVRYHFYGHSNSQLRSQTCFLYAGSPEEISLKVNALGDFSKMKTVAKKAKRIGLLFSTAAVTMNIHPDCVEDIPDVETTDYIFTDGCGLISPDLAQELARRRRIIFRNRRYTPSVFQIRYRGYKGVVEVDPTMPRLKSNSSSTPPISLKLRKSMKKFSGGDDYSFSIVDYSKPYSYGYLNDESITLLSALGITRETLHQKQNDHFRFMEEATHDPRAAFRFLSYINMPELAERVLMEDNLDQIQSKIKGLVKAEYGKMLNKRDDQKCRILIPQSRLLFGVCDAWDCLKEGECAVKVTLFEDGQPAALKGMEVLVTRNPCLHPGDLQKFKVVERPELAHLTDCIVFSSRGRRPAADLMSGGDLDGDAFFVCWDKDIIPSTISEPAKYPGAKEAISFKPITDEDRLVYFAKYNAISLGRVKNLYLAWARARGPMVPECQELNRLYSQCVDGNFIKVPPRLEKAPDPLEDAPPFILDDLHDAAVRLIQANTTKVHGNVLDGFDFDVVELLLNRDDIAMSEFEFICMTQRWCLRNNAHLEDFLDYFDFNVLTDEEKAWVLQQMPPSQEIPALVMNAVSYSSLIAEDAARRFQLSHHSIHWKCIYNSSTRDRMGTFLDATSKALETFHRKLIILQVDERLTVAIYVPRKIGQSQDCVVDDTVRLFAFPHTQGTERQSRMTLPTKMTYRLYCDDRQFQLFEGQRGNTWIFINRSPSDDSSYRATENTGDRRRQRQATIDAGINFDFRASIALDKFSRGLQRHVGRVNRNGVTAAEVYVISNRDVKSMRNLDLWLEHVDTDTTLPLFDQEAEEYTIPTLKDVDWCSEPDFILAVAKEGKIPMMRELRSPKEFEQLFSWLFERDQSPILFKCFDYLLLGISTNDPSRLTRVSSADILRAMLGFLRRTPSLAITFGRMPAIEVVDENTEELVDILEAYAHEILTGFILSANDTKELVVVPLKSYLSRIKVLSTYHFAELVKLISLTVRQPEVAMDILLGCLEPEASRLLPGRPAVVNHFVRNAISIALEHIGEASEDSKTRKDLLKLDLLDRDEDGYQVVEICFRVDSDSGRLENAAHVRLTAASAPTNCLTDKRYSIDALVIKSEPGRAEFQCFHPLPPYYDKCQWKLTYCAPFTTAKTTFDAVLLFATQSEEYCPISSHILGLPLSTAHSEPSPPASFTPYPNLNTSQNLAVSTSLTTPLLCLWGPPGTGKTETILSIILSFQSSFPDSRILITAPTHNAVDNVLRRYLSRSPAITPLRLSTEIRKVASDVMSYTLDAMAGVELNSIQNRSKMKEAKKRVKAAKIVFSTCIGSNLGLLRNEMFDTVIIDEASQQTEGCSLVPLVKGCERAVLVGDHVQLRPTVRPEVAALGGDCSLFERLFTTTAAGGKGVERRMLDTQYRMHASLCEFPSREFYQGRLLTGLKGEERELGRTMFPWPPGEGKRGGVWVECGVREEVGGKSKINEGQAGVCLRVCKLLTTVAGKEEEGGKVMQTVAVLTPYAKQVELLKRVLAQVVATGLVEVSSIDAFQGREADVVVFVTVRCNELRKLGFLTDLRRINVALTRAKRGLVVIGNKETLTKGDDEESTKLWKRLIGGLEPIALEQGDKEEQLKKKGK
ncbi:putative RNA-dependent RNA polymerase [Triangularia verruculosa]|uniref:RNA-dependent RNA polymerase n=1 Tax=Triangularia verruculosa TaxID=2587418 RepID=A0AAN6XB22_9PEZI|nr:putative RNA-dependent RNA polymerase [Triangularia verruculosa]